MFLNIIRPEFRPLAHDTFAPSHLRPVILKPSVGFSKSAIQTQNAENADVPPTPGKQGSAEILQNDNAENAGAKTRKRRMTGFDVTAPPCDHQGHTWGELKYPCWGSTLTKKHPQDSFSLQNAN